MEVKDAIMSLKRDSAPGPDGFGSIYFQIYWDFIGQYVINAVIPFFKDKWILPHYNSNSIVLIPKIKGTNIIDQYTLIAL